MSSGFLPFQEARAIVHALGLHSAIDYRKWAKTERPTNIPSSPERSYANVGWSGWADWLNSSRVVTRVRKRSKFLQFIDARNFVRSLGLDTRESWRAWTHLEERRTDIPSHPECYYRNKGWCGFPDWLGVVPRRKSKFHQWLPFIEARAFAHILKLSSPNEWYEWYERECPINIPRNPHGIYRFNGWVGWSDWLGTVPYRPAKRIRQRDDFGNQMPFLPFEEARALVRSIGLHSSSDWWKWVCGPNRPLNIPTRPNLTYAGLGWAGWTDWVGTDIKMRRGPRVVSGADPVMADRVGTDITMRQLKRFLPFSEAKVYVRSLDLKSIDNWRKWCRSKDRHRNIPTRPDMTYKVSGWVSWADWLGHNQPRGRKHVIFRQFEEAKAFVHTLGLRTYDDWRRWSSSGSRPCDIPSAPEYKYANSGWAGWADWLGR